MSNYTPVTNWVGLDSLLDTDPNKVISGSTFDTEFNTIKNAINSKQDTLTVKDEDDMVSDSATAVASQQSIKAYVDSTATTTRTYRGTRTTIYSGSTASVTAIPLTEDWDTFDELVFFLVSDSNTSLRTHRVDVLDILEAATLTSDGDYRVDEGTVWQFDIADKTQITTTSENSIMRKIVGIKYE